MPVSKSQLRSELEVALEDLLPEKTAKERKQIALSVSDHLLLELAPDIYDDDEEEDPEEDADLLAKLDGSEDW